MTLVSLVGLVGLVKVFSHGEMRYVENITKTPLLRGSAQPNKQNPLYMLYTEPTQSCTNAQLITKAHKHVPVKLKDSLIPGIGSHERHEHGEVNIIATQNVETIRN